MTAKTEDPITSCSTVDVDGDEHAPANQPKYSQSSSSFQTAPVVPTALSSVIEMSRGQSLLDDDDNYQAANSQYDVKDKSTKRVTQTPSCLPPSTAVTESARIREQQQSMQKRKDVGISVFIDDGNTTNSGPLTSHTAYAPTSTAVSVGHANHLVAPDSATTDFDSTTIRSAYTNETHQPTQLQIHYYGLALVFLAPALGGFLYGYDIGASSFVLRMILADRNHDNWWHKFPTLHQGLFVSALALGALIGSHIVLVYLAESIGRRKEIRIAATLYIVGAMLNVMSGTVLATTGTYGGEKSSFNFGVGLVTLLSGRLLYGAGVGFIMHSAPAYMAEMSPSEVRGTIVSAKETVIVFGIIVGMLMGDLQSDYPDNWCDLYGYSILFAVPMLLLTLKIPRSKRWLLMKGNKEEAKTSMQFVYKDNVSDEFERMAETINNICCRDNSIPDEPSINTYDSFYGDDHAKIPKDNRNSFHDGVIDDKFEDDKPQGMFSPKYRGIMIIGVGMLIAQQYSGQPCVLAYSSVLFEAAGWEGHASVITVTIMGIASLFTVSMVDRLGRKTLLATGSMIMLISVSCLAYGFWGWDEEKHGQLDDVRKHVVLWSMFIFISGYQVGFGPITWTVLSEIYPTEIRSPAMALSVEVNFFSKFLTQLFFPIIQEILGWGSTFAVFGCIIAAGLIFIIFQVPETKGLTLEEIRAKLKRSRPTVGANVGHKRFIFCPWIMSESRKSAASPLLSDSYQVHQVLTKDGESGGMNSASSNEEDEIV